MEASVPGVCPVHLPSHSPTHPPTDTVTGACAQIHVCFRCTRSHTPPRTLALPLSLLSLGSRWWGVRLVAPPPHSKPPAHHPPTNTTPPLFVLLRSLTVERRAPACPPPYALTNPWLAAIGGTQSGVLMLQLGEETLVNLPIACHWPWPGLFVSGTPLISPSTPSSVLPPSLPTQFLYPETVSSFLKDHPLFPLRMSFKLQ